MKVPNCDNAIVPIRKITHYLLSKTHPLGSSKSRLFRSWGFDDDNVEELIHQLLKIIHTRKIFGIKDVKYIINYEVHGKIRIPNGGIRKLITIWAIIKGESTPTFVTAYPP